ncbi:F-box domain-containing protein [Colletotrichum orchidophilum]|uniref:F-box domain-containing protein n=1 Tax=Colletotrichum orchidophilum TaxID=1209926 RepID=A0A1G4B468_9PEZI|nr:F-box domain-containing protein [Colletotrichum orchidophilum]OHE96156.1 F-box domain-containing protein [Colletotrichum orchidophilum]
MSSTYSSLFMGPHMQSDPTDCDLGTLDGLEGLPLEIIFDIYHQLDVRSIFSLAQVNTLFHGLLKRNKAAILLPVLQREFSPLPELLQVFTASDQDMLQYGDTFQPRRVVFRRFPGDMTGVTLSRGGIPHNAGALNGDQPARATLPSPRSVTLVERDLKSLLKYCLVTRHWEELFPQLHWFATPEDCRQLDEPEKFKLRRALYRWWLYAFYFHGELLRPRSSQPEPFVNDIRTSHMRLHSTRELIEMRDLFLSMKNLVRYYIYPNLEQNLEPVDESSPLETMIETSIRERIVDTYAKLDPRDLMFYFDNLFNYPRKRLVTDVNLKHPAFSQDQESLVAAVQSAADERPWLYDIVDLTSIGGIVTSDEGLDEHLGRDGSHDGSIPPPGAFRRPRGIWAPPGDDGRALAERSHSHGGQRY